MKTKRFHCPRRNSHYQFRGADLESQRHIVLSDFINFVQHFERQKMSAMRVTMPYIDAEPELQAACLAWHTSRSHLLNWAGRQNPLAGFQQEPFVSRRTRPMFPVATLLKRQRMCLLLLRPLLRLTRKYSTPYFKCHTRNSFTISSGKKRSAYPTPTATGS